MPKAKINGIELYYEEHGEGPAVVFVHGAGGNHMSWWQQVPVFSPSYRCVTFDQRGFGASANTTGDEGTETLHRDLAGLMDHLEIPQAMLVAQSLGGWAVWGLAERHPERVRAIVMADTPGDIPAPLLVSWARKGGIRRRDGEDVLDRAFSPRLHDERPALAYLYRQIQGLNPQRQPRARVNILKSLADREPMDLSHVSIPALFIVGEEDDLIPPEVIEAAAAAIPGAQFLKVPGAGHSVYFEKAEIFNDAVLRFFESVE
ncbi:MAG: alpha/beta hydrolase [Chloroflexi bacterium]|nr:alpha/beta hydrolase [Chloroflexota bacterium]